MLGKNLLTLIIEQEDARDKRLAADKTDPIQTLPLVPLAQLKSVCRDVLRGLDFLHTTCGLVHTDIKPENLSLALYDGHDEFFADSAAKPAADNDTAAVSGAAEKLDDKPKTIKPDNIKMEDTKPAKPPAATTAAAKDIKTASVEKNGFCVENEVFCDGAAAGVGGGWGRVKILDLGNSVALGEVDDSEIATVQYRAPEIILGQVYSQKVDIWAFACVVFEMATGDYLFDPREPKDYSYTRDIDHLALMIELLGPMPKRFTQKGVNAAENFGRDGKLKHVQKFDFWNLEDVLSEKYRFPRAAAAEMADFLLTLLRYDPRERLSAEEALRHPWLG